jgi:hypothetical protein
MREPANTSRQQDNDRESSWRALYSNSLDLLDLLNHLSVEPLTTESTLRFSKIHILTTLVVHCGRASGQSAHQISALYLLPALTDCCALKESNSILPIIFLGGDWLIMLKCCGRDSHIQCRPKVCNVAPPRGTSDI